MPNVLTLKRRIKTAKNVSKTTRAMQLIATSKLKKAQDAAVVAKPYAKKLDELTKNISSQQDAELIKYTTPPNASSKLVVVASPDKGLSGGLVTSLVKEALNEESKMKVFYIAVGKKIGNYLNAFGKEIVASFSFGTTIPPFESVYPILNIVDDYFLSERVNSVEIVTTQFISVFTQQPHRERLLPIHLEDKNAGKSDFLFEPSAQEILPDLLRHYLEISIYQSLLESYASEQAARMIAMKSATDNANDIIDALTLSYNKTRQEKITNELLDISGGFLNV